MMRSHSGKSDVTVSRKQAVMSRRAARLQRQELNVGDMPGSAAEVMMNDRQPGSRVRLRLPPRTSVGPGATGIYHQPMIGVHPRALLEFDDEPGRRTNSRADERRTIRREVLRWPPRPKGIATLGAAVGRTIVRLSDFKSNEYANTVGGEAREPEEEPDARLPRGAGRPRFKLPRLFHP